MYKCSHEEHPRRRGHRREMRFDPYLPIKVKCPKIFEVEDKINLVLLIYDELSTGGTILVAQHMGMFF